MRNLVLVLLLTGSIGLKADADEATPKSEEVLRLERLGRILELREQRLLNRLQQQTQRKAQQDMLVSGLCIVTLVLLNWSR